MRFLAVARVLDRPPGAATADMEAEIAKGRALYEEGFLLQGYMDPDYRRAVLIVEASYAEAAAARLAEYPQVQAGETAFDLQPLVGRPGIAQVHAARNTPLPAWWPEPQS